jgi:uncharacterized protein YkwD
MSGLLYAPYYAGHLHYYIIIIMKWTLMFSLLICMVQCMGQAPGAAPYLSKVAKYNEASVFEDVRYKNIDWKAFYKLDEANELVDPFNFDFDLLNAAVFFAVNKYRASKGLPQLKFEPRLRDAAVIHSYEMVKKNFFDHMNYTDAKLHGPDTRIELCGYRGQKLAENLARGYADRGKPQSYTQLADKAVMELSRSSEHNKHLTDPGLEKLGCGVLFENTATAEGITYFRLTQDFGTDWK